MHGRSCSRPLCLPCLPAVYVQFLAALHSAINQRSACTAAARRAADASVYCMPHTAHLQGAIGHDVVEQLPSRDELHDEVDLVP